MIDVLEKEFIYMSSDYRMVCCVIGDFVGVVVFVELEVRLIEDLWNNVCFICCVFNFFMVL